MNRPAKRNPDPQHLSASEHRERLLDEALEATFPASDPVSLTLPPGQTTATTATINAIAMMSGQ